MSAEQQKHEPTVEPIFTLGAIFAFYVFVEGVVRAYEWITGHHLEITDNDGLLRALSIGGNLIFAGHFLFSAWESRRITALVAGLALLGGAAFGFYLWVSSLPEQGRKWLSIVEQMPDGTVFPDPYDHGKLKRKESWGIVPYNGAFDTTRPQPCITPNVPVGCQLF